MAALPFGFAFADTLARLIRADPHAVGGAALGWSCFGVSDHGPVSFRRVGQSVDRPGKARR